MGSTVVLMSASPVSPGNGTASPADNPTGTSADGLIHGNGVRDIEMQSPAASSKPVATDASAGGVLNSHSNGVISVSPFAGTSGQSIRAEGSNHSREGEDESPRPRAFITPPQRMVSWQDEVSGQDLYTVREFEPSDGGQEMDHDRSWENERKACCSIM